MTSEVIARMPGRASLSCRNGTLPYVLGLTRHSLQELDNVHAYHDRRTRSSDYCDDLHRPDPGSSHGEPDDDRDAEAREKRTCRHQWRELLLRRLRQGRAAAADPRRPRPDRDVRSEPGLAGE